jgi:hypothetical protein
VNAQKFSRIKRLPSKRRNSEEVRKTLISKSKNAYDTTKKPIICAFYAVGNFFMAKHASNPLNKYSYFNKGKKLLEDELKRTQQYRN